MPTEKVHRSLEFRSTSWFLGSEPSLEADSPQAGKVCRALSVRSFHLAEDKGLKGPCPRSLVASAAHLLSCINWSQWSQDSGCARACLCPLTLLLLAQDPLDFLEVMLHSTHQWSQGPECARGPSAWRVLWGPLGPLLRSGQRLHGGGRGWLQPEVNLSRWSCCCPLSLFLLLQDPLYFLGLILHSTYQWSQGPGCARVPAMWRILCRH